MKIINIFLTIFISTNLLALSIGEKQKEVSIEAENGGFVKGMSKKVDYLVTNNVNSNSAKAKKAREYGKPIISYDELMVMLGFDLS